MDGQNYVVFHKDSNDSYMNSSANFRGADVGTTFIDLYFESALSSSVGASAYDKIRLAVTATYEEATLEKLGAALSGSKNPVTVIASDVSGSEEYIDEKITAVTSITLATSGVLKNIKTWAADTTLLAGDSGSWIYASDATAGDLTLPAAAAGLEFHIFIAIAQTGDTHITVPSGYFIGGLDMSDPTTAGDSNFFQSDGDSNDWINLDADTKGRLAGGYINIVCDGTNWHVQGHLVGDGTLATPFADAES